MICDLSVANQNIKLIILCSSILRWRKTFFTKTLIFCYLFDCSVRTLVPLWETYWSSARIKKAKI